MNPKVRKTLIAIGIPVAYGIVLRVIFGIDSISEIFRVMSITFLALVPTTVGFLVVYFSSYENAQSLSYRIFQPWFAITIIFFITIVVNLEGWACWLMVFPVFLFASSVGGLIAGIVKKPKGNDKLKISLALLLPFCLGPLEGIVDVYPEQQEAYTYIDIEAPADVIWDHVTKVSEIKADEDTGYLNKLLGFPRPVEAELNYEGVGAYRKAVFTNGLVFHETVTEYKDNQRMAFTIKAYPHEIPSTTLDEHVVIGGDYFDVIEGIYELEPLKNGIHRLHLTSTFEVTTTFNFYAGWWAKQIMSDIQNNILKVEKNRSESSQASVNSVQ